MKKLTLVTLFLSSLLTLLSPTQPVFSDPGRPTPHAPSANAPVFLPLVKQGTTFAPPTSSTQVTSLSTPSSAGRYSKYEIVLSLSRSFTADSFKPYYPYSDDSEGITVDAYFTSPSGKTIVMPAFYYQDQIRSGSTTEVMTATNNYSWRVRFAPAEVGTYKYYIAIQDKTGTSRYPQTGFLTFNSVASSNVRGFVRVSPRDGRFMEFDNGQSFVPIGSGRQWWKCCGARTLDYEQAFNAFGANGINLTRVWTQDDGWSLTVEGHFDGYTYPDDYNPVDRGVNIDTLPKGTQINQRGGKELDLIVEAAERNGVYLQLCSRGDPYWIWQYSIYDESWNNGLVPFDDPYYLAQWKRNFRYQVARWGYSTSVLAWEHWNELGHVPVGSEIWDFYVAFNAYQRATDPYKHLITTSQGSQAYSPAFWSQLFDIGNYHNYLMDWMDPALTRDEANMVYKTAWCIGGRGLCGGLGLGDSSVWSGAQKPFVWGEMDVGTNVWNVVNPGAKSGEGRLRFLHNSAWAGLFSPTGTVPLDWYWEQEDAATTTARYADRKITAQFFNGVDYVGQNFAYLMTANDAPSGYTGQTVASTNAQARVYAMRGNSMVLAWVQNRNYTWYNASVTPSTFAVTVTIPGVNGNYSVSLFDTHTGTSTSLGTIAANGSLVVSSPTVQTDIAIKAVKQ